MKSLAELEVLLWQQVVSRRGDLGALEVKAFEQEANVLHRAAVPAKPNREDAWSPSERRRVRQREVSWAANGLPAVLEDSPVVE